MKKFKFCVLGDIHYPKSKTEEFFDAKVANIPSILKGDLSSPVLSIVMQEVAKEHQRSPYDAVLIAGDFTDGGCEAGFSDCLEFLNAAMSNFNCPIFAVPGNHDLKFPEDLMGNAEKFSNYQDIYESSVGPIILSFDSLTKFDGIFSDDEDLGPKSLVRMFGVNSCLGCADLWKVENPDVDLAKIFLGPNGETIDESEKYTRFDAPYVDKEAIEGICAEFGDATQQLAIVLGHHNILPQRTPRLAVFPEMLNSGLIRDKFVNSPKSIIYVHGHIHDQVVDVLKSGEDFGDIGLVSIGAPLLQDGFLNVEIYFLDDGVPFFVKVAAKNTDPAGVTPGRVYKIRLLPEVNLGDVLSENEQQCLADVAENENVPFGELTAAHDRRTVELLETVNLLSIRRPAASTATWRVSRH